MRLPFNGSYPLTQGFGTQVYIGGVNIYTALGMLGHNGNDYGLPSGTPVVAAHAGTVYRFTETAGGNCIIITGGGVQTLYGHLSGFSVAQGTNVAEGQQIALSGATGQDVTGPHLHFGVRPVLYNSSNGYGGWVDPAPYLKGGTMPIDTGALADFRLDMLHQIRDVLGLQAIGTVDGNNIDQLIKAIKDLAGLADGRQNELNQIGAKFGHAVVDGNTLPLVLAEIEKLQTTTSVGFKPVSELFIKE